MTADSCSQRSQVRKRNTCWCPWLPDFSQSLTLQVMQVLKILNIWKDSLPKYFWTWKCGTTVWPRTTGKVHVLQLRSSCFNLTFVTFTQICLGLLMLYLYQQMWLTHLVEIMKWGLKLEPFRNSKSRNNVAKVAVKLHYWLLLYSSKIWWLPLLAWWHVCQSTLHLMFSIVTEPPPPPEVFQKVLFENNK